MRASVYVCVCECVCVCSRNCVCVCTYRLRGLVRARGGRLGRRLEIEKARRQTVQVVVKHIGVTVQCVCARARGSE